MQEDQETGLASSHVNMKPLQDNRMLALNVAAERLSIVRYVFLVQIEDGIASAKHRASLEYADTVLMGWPDDDQPNLTIPDDNSLQLIQQYVRIMEAYIARFSEFERLGDVDAMADVLREVAQQVAQIRSAYQPDVLLPTFTEIQHVIQDEWDEEMGNIHPECAGNVEQLRHRTEEEHKD